MELVVWLKVKFRAFGITFGTVQNTWRYPLAVFGVLGVRPDLIHEGTLVNVVNERGVWLVVKVAQKAT